MDKYINITGDVNGNTLRGQVAAVNAADGLSAYEIAVQQGFEGTVEEWLESLQGGGGYELTEEDKADIKESVIEELPVYDENHQIIVKENGTTTLATAGMWCERDLEIVTNVSGGEYTPILQDKSATPTKSKQTFNADEGFDGIGTFTVEAIPGEYIIPSGTKDITSNGTHDVTDKASVKVNVPIPDGYIKPSGTKSITTNGTHDVKQYASATVNVPIPEGYIVPSGSLEITESGEYDVTTYAKAVVNVSGGGSLVEYSGSTWLGESIAYPMTTSFSINVGAEIPEKFHFYAMNFTGATSENRVPQIMRDSNGACRLVKCTTSSNGTSTVYLFNRVEADSSCIQVSADRRSITYYPPSGTHWPGGTWYWTIVAEG